MSYGVKVCLLGDGGVGKTSIRRRYLGHQFTTTYIETIGADFAKKIIKIDDIEFIYQIWDLAGQKRYNKVRSLYYTGVRGALIVYDVTRPESLENISHWVEELLYNSIKAIPIILIGNKSDLLPEVDEKIQKNAKNIAQNVKSTLELHVDIPIHTIETSAKTGVNINKAFDLLGESLLMEIRKTLPK